MALEILFKKIPLVGKEGKWRKIFPRLRILLLTFTFIMVLISVIGIINGIVSSFILKELKTLLKNNYGIIAEYENILLFPEGKIVINNISLKTDDNINLLTCKDIIISLDYSSFFIKNNIEDIYIYNLDLYFIFRKDGSLNWKLKESSSKDTLNNKITFPNILIKNINLQNCNLFYDTLNFKNINFSAKLLSVEERIVLFVNDLDCIIPFNNLNIFGSANIYLKNNLSGKSKINISSEYSNLQTIIDFDINNNNYNLILDTLKFNLSEIKDDFNGICCCKGKINLSDIDTTADLNLNVFDFKYNNYSFDSLFSDIKYNNNILKVELEKIFILNSQASGSISYYLYEDSILFNSELINVNPSIISKEIKDSLIKDITAEINGWVKNIKNIDSLSLHATFSISNTALLNNYLSNINGNIDYLNKNLSVVVESNSENTGNINAFIKYTDNNDLIVKGQISNMPLKLINQLSLYDKNISGNLSGNFTLFNRTISFNSNITNLLYENYYIERFDLRADRICVDNFTGKYIYLNAKNLKQDNIIIDSINLKGIGIDHYWNSELYCAMSEYNLFCKGNVDPIKYNVILDTININIIGTKLYNTEPIEINFNNNISYDTISLINSDGMIILSSLNILNNSIDGFLTIDSFSLNQLKYISPQFDKLSGYINMNSHINGSIPEPDIEVDLFASNCNYDTFLIDSILLYSEINKNYIIIDKCQIGAFDDIVKLHGIIPFSKKDSIDIKVQFKNIGLWPFEYISYIVEPLQGDISGDISINGIYEDIDIYGNAEFSNGKLFVIITRDIIENVSGNIKFQDDSISLYFSGENNDGTFEIFGGAYLVRGFEKIESWWFRIPFKNIIFAGLEGVWANVTGEVKIDIDTLSISTISGEVKINDALLTIPSSSDNQTSQDQNLPNMDLYIDGSDGNIFFKSYFADAELKGNLYISSFNNILETKGDLNVIRGKIFYLDRSFNITNGKIFVLSSSNIISGQIFFQGETKLNYSIPSQGGTPLREEVTIYIEVRGNIESPEFIISSEPKLSQQDIASLLTFGTTWSNLSSFSSIAQAVPNRAVNYLLRTQIFSKLEKYLNISTISLETEMGPVNSAKLTLGKYLTNSIYIEFKKDIINNIPSEVSIQYNIWKNTSLIFNKEDEDIYGLGIKWIWRY